jgi:hypothetical protein
MVRIETLRYRDEKVGKLRWWGDLQHPAGNPDQLVFNVVWEDEGTPWLVYRLEEVVYNSDVSTYLRQKGP